MLITLHICRSVLTKCKCFCNTDVVRMRSTSWVILVLRLITRCLYVALRNSKNCNIRIVWYLQRNHIFTGCTNTSQKCRFIILIIILNVSNVRSASYGSLSASYRYCMCKQPKYLQMQYTTISVYVLLYTYVIITYVQRDGKLCDLCHWNNSCWEQTNALVFCLEQKSMYYEIHQKLIHVSFEPVRWLVCKKYIVMHLTSSVCVETLPRIQNTKCRDVITWFKTRAHLIKNTISTSRM